MRRFAYIILMALAALLVGCPSKTEYIHVGPNWAALQDLEPENTFRFGLSTPDQVVLGDAYEIRVTSARAGRLWVIQVDGEDRVDVLFPNAHERDNSVEADATVRVPGDGARFELNAEDPGLSYIAAILTQGDTSLDVVFTQGKEQMQEAIRIARQADAWAIERRIVEVVVEEG